MTLVMSAALALLLGAPPARGPAPRRPSSPPKAPAPTTPAPSPAKAADPATDEALLVLELRPIGISADEAHMVTMRVAELTATHVRGRVLTLAEVANVVQHQSDLGTLGCDTNACIAEASKIANARRVLSGTVGRVGSSFVVNLNLLDAERATPLAGGSRSAPTLDEVVAGLPGVVGEVFPEGQGQRARFALPKGKKLSLAVFDLKPMGITKETADNLTQVLAGELKQVEGTRVVSRDDIVSMLEMQAQKDQLGCDGGTACLAEIGGALGVDDLVVGHAGKLGDSYVVSLRLISVQTVSVENRVTETFVGQEDQLLRAVRAAGRALLGVEARAPGVLALSASEPAAEVFLDETKAGAMPMPPLADLLPGRHRLRLSKSGFVDWVSDVYVDPATTNAVWAQMQETPPRWYQRWWVWTAVGAVAVGGGVAAIYASQAGSKSSMVTVNLK
jgi:TolB-like protein